MFRIDTIATTNVMLLLILVSFWANFVLKRLHHRHSEQRQKDQKRKARTAQIIGRLARPLDVIAARTTPLRVFRANERGDLRLVNIERMVDLRRGQNLIKVNVDLGDGWNRGNRSIVIELPKVNLPEFDEDYAQHPNEEGDYHFFADDSGVERALQLLTKIAEQPTLLEQQVVSKAT